MLQLEPGREAEGPAVLPILEGQRLIQALKQELAAGYVRRFGHSRPRSCVCAGVHCWPRVYVRTCIRARLPLYVLM